jgi:hypothetical protein
VLLLVDLNSAGNPQILRVLLVRGTGIDLRREAIWT